MSSWFTHVNELITQGEHARAAEDLERRLAEDPKNVQLRQILAEVLVLDGREKQAVSLLEGTVRELIADGLVTKAIAILKKIQTIDPDQQDAALMIPALVEMQQKNAAAEAAAEPDPAAAVATAVPRSEVPAERLAAVAGVQWLQQRGLDVCAVSGMLAASPLAIPETTSALGLPVLAKKDLADPAVALGLLTGEGH